VPEQLFSEMEATLKKVVAALRGADVPFLLGGSLASWARGGPQTRHDLDFMVPREHAERAVQALEAAGLRREEPPEEWLFKAWDGDVLVDLIYGPSGMDVDAEMLARGETLSVMSMDVPVMSLEDLVITKLLSITEHEIRYEGLLAIARALREQIPWERVRARTAHSPFSRAFFVLCEDLGIQPEPAPAGRARVRVVAGEPG
jgi:putative nucleotidyltransferase-like protein